ncbi:hypothetical protein MXMO3_01705 [Maritalea myrionectae]|uniref:Uncharacterized protein n=1 Tax=Maritalea myrionectae TaxID=454601 RepID=A0A2R4MDW7_9HYPH|nr:hypothetical protein [Maritalea myrionectae]AVX04231.1 hypothetical protein MXMO3_01705 [Maritalea myrionectae]
MQPKYPCDDSQRAAAMAVRQGTANDTQQVVFFNWIVQQIAEVQGMSFRQDPYETAFNEGKRFVGQSIIDASTPSSNPKPNP